MIGHQYIYTSVDPKATGQAIQQVRIENGLSVLRFTESLGVTPQAYYKWIRGDSLPTLDNLVILRRLYDVSLDDIVTTREIPEREL